MSKRRVEDIVRDAPVYSGPPLATPGPRLTVRWNGWAIPSDTYELSVSLCIMPTWRFGATRHMGAGGPVYTLRIGRLRLMFTAWRIHWSVRTRSLEECREERARMVAKRKERYGE